MASQGERAEALTHRALDAARSGRWDEALRCYCERGAVLGEAELSMALAGHLSAIDREIDGHARTALAAVSAALEDTAAARHRLRRVRDLCALAQGIGRLTNCHG